jgi:hypothetical protein
MMEPVAGSSRSVSTVTGVRKGRKSRAPPPSLEEVQAGLLLVNQCDAKKVRKMKKSLLVAVCCSKFGGSTDDYECFTVNALILKLVRRF